ncbi:ribulose-phosphate 3-epimerase [Candidatus Woesearchaeota archaeon]|nr:ribulose-phosphate 3-epimerase [Candidatus Woesearchaeota archaeon]
MTLPIRIAPSVLSADFGALNAELKRVENADWLHVDVMDGHFVPALTLGPVIMKRMKTELPCDVHLMVEHPELHIRAFADAGASVISVHLEACQDPKAALVAIRDLGVRAGLALKPGTPVERAYPYLGDMDMLLVMTVEPGASGQEFMPLMLQKVRLARSRAPMLDIEVDGGINEETIRLAASAGANVFVAGSAVFGKSDPGARVGSLRAAAEGEWQKEVYP